MANQVARTLYQQMGGSSLHGAVNLTGGTKVVLGNDGPLVRQEATPEGFMSTDNSVVFRPNTKALTKFVITLEPSDTYAIALWKGLPIKDYSKTGKAGKILYQEKDVYFDMLVDVIDDIYVRYLKEHEGGFIPLD